MPREKYRSANRWAKVEFREFCTVQSSLGLNHWFAEAHRVENVPETNTGLHLSVASTPVVTLANQKRSQKLINMKRAGKSPPWLFVLVSIIPGTNA